MHIRKKKGRERMKKKLVIAALAIVILSVGGVVLATKNNADVPAPTPIVTKTPTEAVEPTKEPAETPQVTEVVTVAPTEGLTPTVAPVVTVEPTATPVPTPVPSMLPTPTPTAVPTETPVHTTPTPVPVAEEDLLLKVQTGDNAWYKYYEGGILVVEGTGAIWNFYGEGEPDLIDLHYEKIGEDATHELIDSVKKLIIAEGITRIGNYALGMYDYVSQVSVPSTLKEVGIYGLRSIGLRSEKTEWTGLNISKLSVHEKSFFKAKGLEGMETGNLILNPTATPTPTPTNTPTPTPIPDPNNPRLCHTFKMGANVTFETWDNGYVYVKGTGRCDDQSELFSWVYTLGLEKSFVRTLNRMVVEEGVTYLGKNICLAASNVKEVWLPKSMERVESYGACADVLHCYRDGKKVKVTSTETKNVEYMFNALSDPQLAEEYGITITEE